MSAIAEPVDRQVANLGQLGSGQLGSGQLRSAIADLLHAEIVRCAVARIDLPQATVWQPGARLQEALPQTHVRLSCPISAQGQGAL